MITIVDLQKQENIWRIVKEQIEFNRTMWDFKHTVMGLVSGGQSMDESQWAALMKEVETWMNKDIKF